MLAHQKRLLADMSDIGGPVTLPLDLGGPETKLSAADLADLSWTDPSLGYRSEDGAEDPFVYGYFPVEVPDPPRPLDNLLAQVNADRDVRIDGGFLHEVDGVEYTFQSRPSDRENVMGMAMAAQGAIAAMQAADPPVNPVGNLRWFDPDNDFQWITADNTLAPMDALQTIDLFKAGAAFKAGVTFAARAYKDAMIADGTDAGAQAIYDSIVWPE